jgi:hypothetical protein
VGFCEIENFCQLIKQINKYVHMFCGRFFFGEVKRDFIAALMDYISKGHKAYIRKTE